MANSYTQLYVQLVYAVKHRSSLIREDIRAQVERYTVGIISKRKCVPLAIYANPDHVHVLVSLHPSISVSVLCRDVKALSSKWINEQGWFRAPFRWQQGYGAFGYSKSQVEQVQKYIRNQPQHHKKVTFKEEYLNMLRREEISFEEAYLFDWLD